MEIDLSDLFSDVNKVNEYLKANSNIGEDLDLNDVFGRLEAAAMSGWESRDRIRGVVQKQIIHDLGLIKKEEKVSKVSPAPKTDLLETAVKPSIRTEAVTNKRKNDELTLSTKLDLEDKKLKICKFASASLFDDAQNTMMTDENQTAPVVKNDKRMAISWKQKDGNITDSQFGQKPNVAEVICNDELKPTTPKHVSVNGAIRGNDGMGGTFIVVSDNSDDEDDLAVVGMVGPIIKGSSLLIPPPSSSTASVDTAASSNHSDSGSTSSSSASSSTASVAPTNADNSSEASLKSSSPTRFRCIRKRNLDSCRILDIASSPGPSKAPVSNVTHSKPSSGNSDNIQCSVGNDVSGPEYVAKQLEDMFPHFSPEYLLEKAKKCATIENAVHELLNEDAFEEDSSKVKDDEMKCMKRVAKSLLLLGEEDMFKKVNLTEKRDFNPEDPLENKFRLAKGHYLSVSGQFACPIESIDYVENRALMENFERKKSEFRAEGKETKEYFLFHGTNNVNVDSILKENFRMDFAGKNGQAHGRGIYFSEKTIIPNQYMNGTKKTLLLCRVLLGREFLGLDRDIPEGFDSKSVQPDQEKRANINIVKEVDQILPCFVLNLAPSSGPGPNVLNLAPSSGPGPNVLQFGFPSAISRFNLFPSGFLGGGLRRKPKNSSPTKK